MRVKEAKPYNMAPTGRPPSLPSDGSELQRLRSSDDARGDPSSTEANGGGEDPSANNDGGTPPSSGCCCAMGITCGIFLKYVIGRSAGLGLYSFDIFSDVMMAIVDYNNGDYIFAIITISLIFLPGLLFALYSCVNVRLNNTGMLRFAKRVGWILSTPFLPFWPILRDLHQIYHGFMATLGCNRSYHLKCLNKPSRAYLQKFLEAFTEAAPQVLLRLYRIALRRSQFPFSDLETMEIVQVTVSLVTLSSKMVSTHQKNVTTSLVVNGDLDDQTKFKLPCIAQISGFLWWMCFLFSRFQVMALFAESFHAWIFLVIGIHIILVFLFQTVGTHENLIKKISVYIFTAFVFIFAYLEFNVKTRVKATPWLPYIVFSILLFLENSVMMVLWFLTTQGITIPEGYSLYQLQEHREFLVYIHYATFAAGVIFMAICLCVARFCGAAPKNETEETGTKPMPRPSQRDIEMQETLA